MVRGKVTAVTEFVFRGLKAGAAGIGRVGKAAVTTAAKSKILQTNLDGVGRALKRGVGFATRWTAVLAGVATGAVIAGKSFLELFSTSKQIEAGFKSTSRALGIDWKNALDIARKATRGTIDDMELMGVAGKFLRQASKDVNVMGSTFAKAFDIAKGRGDDVFFIINSITEGIAKQQPLILDNLEIFIKAGEVQKDYAKSVGKTIAQLTLQEKRFAFAQAALKATVETQKLFGVAVEDNADRMARLGVRWTDLKIKIGEVLAESPAVEEFMVSIAMGLENATKWFNENREDIKLWIAGVIDAGKAALQLVGNIGALIGKLTLLDRVLETTTARMQANAAAQAALREAEAPLGPAGPERGRIIERVTQAGVGGQSAEELREARLAIMGAIRDQIIEMQAVVPLGRERELATARLPGGVPPQVREALEQRDQVREFRTEQIRAMRELLDTIEDALRDMNESLVDQASKLRSNLNQQKTDKDVALAESENLER